MRAGLAKGTDQESVYLPHSRVAHTDRIGITEIDDVSVILRFYIQENVGTGSGDKVIYDSSLKSVCANVLPAPVVAEDRTTVVDGFMGAKSISNRIILSPILVGIASRNLEQIQLDIVDMWDNAK